MAKSFSFHWPLRGHPEIRIAVRAPFSPDRNGIEYRHTTFAIHQHFYHARLLLAGRWITLRPGDVTLSPPNSASRYELAEEGFHWCIHFHPADSMPTEPHLRLPLHLPMRGAGGAISERMRAIFEQRRPRRRGNAALAAAASATMLQEMLLHLALLPRGAQPTRAYLRRSDAALDEIKQQLDADFPRRTFAVADLARASKLNRNYFSARFQERFGMTVDGYLLHRRIELARSLLISTTLPMKEVAYECGIPNPNYFNKQFRQATGLSPTAYRGRHS